MPPRGAKVGAAAGLPAEARDLHNADRTESQLRQTVSYMHADFAAADATGQNRTRRAQAMAILRRSAVRRSVNRHTLLTS